MTGSISAAFGRWAVVLTLPAAVLTGCGGGEAEPDRVSVRDSAGIRVVENPSIDGAPECRLSPEPRLDIGTADGRVEFEFHRVTDVTRLPDGRIAVLDGGSLEVRLFGEDGRFSRSFGGEGRGPGELLGPLSLWVRGDSVVIHDAQLHRLSWFTADGTYARQVSIRPPAPGINRAFLLRDGRIVTMEVEFQPPRTGFGPQLLRLVLRAADGETVDTAAEYVWRRMGSVGPEGGGSIVAGPVFGARTYVSATGRRLYVGRGVEPEIEVLAPDGTTERIVRWGPPARRVADEDLALFRRGLLEGAESRNDSAVVRERLDDRPVAEQFPAHDRITVGRDGNLWVQRYRRPDWPEWQRWLVFGETGELRCRLRVPGGFELMDAGDDFVLGTWRDELDVVHVRLYGLEGPGAAG